MQKVYTVEEQYDELEDYLITKKIKRLFLVCGKSIEKTRINSFFIDLEKKTDIVVTRFSDFCPNPTYESVERGINLFKEKRCDIIVAVGGGSAIDVAKCIKLFYNMDSSANYLSQKIVPNDTELIAIPTTAGTGSESTRFAVIYYKGVKQSVSDYSCIPSLVIFDPTFLETLPAYQKKSTMMDALCHATESYWSVNSTPESIAYATDAIRMVLENYEGYFANKKDGNAGMLMAANIAGKAINITQTTAGHAMSYKLTGLYGITHGHAVALCVSKLFSYMIENTDDCCDSRGKEYIDNMFEGLAGAYCCDSPLAASERFDKLLEKCEFIIPKAKDEDFHLLRDSVNPDRLKNNPVFLTKESIENLYHQILTCK